MGKRKAGGEWQGDFLDLTTPSPPPRTHTNAARQSAGGSSSNPLLLLSPPRKHHSNPAHQSQASHMTWNRKTASAVQPAGGPQRAQPQQPVQPAQPVYSTSQPPYSASQPTYPTYMPAYSAEPPYASQPAYSASAGPSSSQPPTKRARKKKDPDAPQPEKRGAMFKKKCPQAVLERVDRVIAQRFFMIERHRSPGELKEEFSVLGSTGNVYTVTIDRSPSCTCPDFLKGNHCKHILFIFLKVLQVTRASGFWYQKALLTSELEQIFAGAPLAPNAAAHERVQEAYARATGRAPSAKAKSSPNGKKRLPGPDDDCPICYENMHKESEAKLEFCEECGNSLHKECFGQWAKRNMRDLTCVWCRAKWRTPAAAGRGGSGATVSAEGYLNLAGVAGLSPQRDTSSYYHGPRRGARYYGYQEYDD